MLFSKKGFIEINYLGEKHFCELNSWSKIEDFCKIALESRGISGSSGGWSIYLNNQNDFYELTDEDYIFDSISELELEPLFSSAKSYLKVTTSIDKSIKSIKFDNSQDLRSTNSTKKTKPLNTQNSQLLDSSLLNYPDSTTEFSEKDTKCIDDQISTPLFKNSSGFTNETSTYDLNTFQSENLNDLKTQQNSENTSNLSQLTLRPCTLIKKDNDLFVDSINESNVLKISSKINSIETRMNIKRKSKTKSIKTNR